MASATLPSVADQFPVGTSVGTYPVSRWLTNQLPPSGAAIGSSVASATVGSTGSLAFTGLADGTEYFAAASISGTWRYRRFITAPVDIPDTVDTAAIQNSAVTSAKVADGTIVNADINASAAIAATKLAISSYDRDNGQAGIVVPSSRHWTPTASGWPNASQSRFVRFVPSRAMTITSISFVVTTFATADDAVDVGIYDATLTKIVSSGATTGKVNTSNAVKNIAITSTPLTAGTVYYAAFAYGAFGGTQASIMFAGYSNALLAQGFGASVPQVDCAYKDAAATLPAGPVTPTGIPSTAPVLFLRES